MGVLWISGCPIGDSDVHAAALDEFVPSCGLSHAAALALQVHLLAETGQGRRVVLGESRRAFCGFFH